MILFVQVFLESTIISSFRYVIRDKVYGCRFYVICKHIIMIIM